MTANQYPSLAEIIREEREVYGTSEKDLAPLLEVLGEVNRLMGKDPSEAQEYVDQISAG